MRYASVIVDLSLEKLDRIFQYAIPEKLEDDIKIGVQVRIGFGKGARAMTGYVVDITDKAEIEESRIKPILAVEKGAVPVESDLIALAAFLRRYYGGTMNQAIKTVLPVHAKTKHKVSRSVKLLAEQEVLDALIAESGRLHHTAKERLLTALREQREIDYHVAVSKLNVSTALLKSLRRQGIIEITQTVDYRNPMQNLVGRVPKKQTVTLNEAQQRVVEEIEAARTQGHLIRGVTGSGKTEIYMELAARAIARGEQSIILIPEISLTFQTLIRFYQRFGERVAIMHSKLSSGERYDQFARAKAGEIDIMIGPRSALFTPFQHLGYLMIDEEQEPSYQSETVPRYHAREVAFARAGLCGGTVVLGSATPSVDASYMAEQGKLQLHELNRRAASDALADVYVVDLREELRRGNRSMLSEQLAEAIRDRLDKGEQTMLFLNRRGVSGFVTCRACGHVVKCPHCDVSLSLHQDGSLKCHYCGYERAYDKQCENCGSGMIGTFKAGTQRVEQMVRQAYPNARILRMDHDTTRAKNSYEDILSAFANHEADILIGTQMIVKGHDFPLVTLVGILAADLSLNVPDYTAAERTFSLLTQAAGRAGRAGRRGEVYIQTYQPDNYAVRAAAAQDYKRFYEREIAYRALMEYPPVRHLLQVFVTSQDEQAATALSNGIAAFLRGRFAAVSVIGPSNASVYRVNDIYRRQLYVKAESHDALADVKDAAEAYLLTQETYKKCAVVYDFH